MPLSVVRRARTQKGAFIVGSTSLPAPLLLRDVEGMKAPIGKDEEEQHS